MYINYTTLLDYKLLIKFIRMLLILITNNQLNSKLNLIETSPSTFFFLRIKGKNSFFHSFVVKKRIFSQKVRIKIKKPEFNLKSIEGKNEEID